MRNTLVTIDETKLDKQITDLLITGESELAQSAKLKAEHFAKFNRPNPKDDALSPFIEGIKTGCENLYAKIILLSQPETHFPLGKLDITRFKEKEKRLADMLSSIRLKIANLELKLAAEGKVSIKARLGIALLLLFFIFLGDNALFGSAAQVVVSNLLQALILSAMISLMILVGAHFTASKLKKADSKRERIQIISISLVLALVAFILLGIVRSTYQESHKISVAPYIFVFFNLLFYIVAILLSYYYLPSSEQLNDHWKQSGLKASLAKLADEKSKLESTLEYLRNENFNSGKSRIHSIMSNEYIKIIITRMYNNLISVFKSTNMAFREDQQTPEGFSDSIPELDFTSIDLSIINPNRTNK
jgi:hypothetical protein